LEADVAESVARDYPVTPGLLGCVQTAVGDVQQLRDRLALYEVLMLLRLAIHSWQKLKVSRLEHALTLLEERTLCLQ
jgi:hypothetical protein